MGVRQKRANRSSISRVRQRPKSKKTILNNPIIAANWDKKQTLSQNYKRLGLSVKLNGVTGGTEKDIAAIRAAKEHGTEIEKTQDSLRVLSGPSNKTLAVSEARVIRDPTTGHILQVIDDGPAARPNPLNDPLNDIESDDDTLEARRESLANQHGKVTARAVGGKTDVVRQLEAQANFPEVQRSTRQSENDVEYIERLVAKHGLDYGKMARDVKSNFLQRSEGDLKKRIKRWQKNGGTVD